MFAGSGMFNFVVSLFKNPKAIFVNGILTKWYLLVMIPAMGIVYKIFLILENRGIFAKLEAFVTEKLQMISDTVDRCTAADLDISSLHSLLQCL